MTYCFYLACSLLGVNLAIIVDNDYFMYNGGEKSLLCVKKDADHLEQMLRPHYKIVRLSRIKDMKQTLKSEILKIKDCGDKINRLFFSFHGHGQFITTVNADETISSHRDLYISDTPVGQCMLGEDFWDNPTHILQNLELQSLLTNLEFELAVLIFDCCRAPQVEMEKMRLRGFDVLTPGNPVIDSEFHKRMAIFYAVCETKNVIDYYSFTKYLIKA